MGRKVKYCYLYRALATSKTNCLFVLHILFTHTATTTAGYMLDCYSLAVIAEERPAEKTTAEIYRVSIAIMHNKTEQYLCIFYYLFIYLCGWFKVRCNKEYCLIERNGF